MAPQQLKQPARRSAVCGWSGLLAAAGGSPNGLGNGFWLLPCLIWGGVRADGCRSRARLTLEFRPSSIVVGPPPCSAVSYTQLTMPTNLPVTDTVIASSVIPINQHDKYT